MSAKEEFLPIQGPPIDPAWLARKRQKIAEEDARYQSNETARDHEFMAGIIAFAEEEAKAWAALPCGGNVDDVGKCSDEYAATCDRRQHGMCPRRLYRNLQNEQMQEHHGRRSEAIRYGVPLHIVRVVWDQKPEVTKARQALEQALAGQPAPLVVVLSGGVGCGKSCAAGEEMIKRAGRFITSADLGKESPYEDGMKNISKAKFLVIDDLGCEYLDPKGFFLSTFDWLINHRIGNELTTIITTNLPAKPPKDDPQAKSFQQYGERVLDRIREVGRFVHVGGESMRKKKPNAE